MIATRFLLLVGATLLLLPAASAGVSPTLRAMVYCDNVTTDSPDCGTSAREGSTADCPSQPGPCFYARDGGVGVGAVLYLPEGYDHWICEHPDNCYGIVVSPELPGESPCALLVRVERPGPDLDTPARCPTEQG